MVGGGWLEYSPLELLDLLAGPVVRHKQGDELAGDAAFVGHLVAALAARIHGAQLCGVGAVPDTDTAAQVAAPVLLFPFSVFTAATLFQLMHGHLAEVLALAGLGVHAAVDTAA